MPLQTVELIQNGFEADGVTPKTEPRFLRNTSGLTILDSNNQLISHGFGDVADASLGAQRVTDTLTFIRQKVIKQTFYEVNLLDYASVQYGEGAWMQSLLQYKEYSTSDDFESGNVNMGGNDDRMAASSAALSSQTIPLRNYIRSINWTTIELQQALMANNWDVVAAKLRAKAKAWQLGIQSTFFLGSKTEPTVIGGLLNNTGYAINTSRITKLINTMTATEFQAFVAGVIQDYQANVQYNVYPDTFVIPSDDWNGLATATSSSFPIGSMMTYLENAFKAICGPNFRILPSAYGVPANNTAYGVNKHLYLLYRRDPDDGYMAVPVDLQTMAPGTSDNFHYITVAAGQYSGFTVLNNLRYLAFQF